MGYFDGNLVPTFQLIYYRRMTVKRACALVAGTAVTFVGLAVLLFIAKGLGDLLFPEIPGLSVTHVVLGLSIAVLMAAVLFFEAYRLFKAAAGGKETR
jgi:hypothetical protein